MIEINKVIVPSSTGDGIGNLSYKDGKLVSYEHGSVVNVYLFHETDGESQRAFEITVSAPVTYDKCVNAAEMAAYGLTTAMDVAAFGASLARKQRSGENADEVLEHDRFIGQVKDELALLGLAPSVLSALEIAVNRKLRELEAYDKSDDVNGFTVNGEPTWIDATTRSNYRGSLDDAVLLGKTEVRVPIGGRLLPMSVSEARLKLAQIQDYADECSIVTKMHEATILQLQTVEDVEGYDITSGYPPKLAFNVNAV